MKKLLIGLAAVVVLVIAAALIVPSFVPLDTYKAKIIALVKAQTGRDLRIAGPVKFALLPSIALEANDVSLSNPSGATSPDMVQLKTLAVELKLFPLLHGAIEVAQFKLVDPAIALEVDKQGRPSWAFTPAPAAPAANAAPAAPATPASGGGSAPGFSSISLGDVSIVNGQASYLDQRTGDKKLLSNINMTLSLPSSDQPFTAKGSATWNGETATLTLEADKPATLQSGGTSPIAITLAATPINFAFKGNATGATMSKLDGGIDLSIPSIRDLAKWLGVTFNAPGTGFGQFTLSGKIDMAGPKIAFTNAVIALDSIKATGALTLDSAAPSRISPAASMSISSTSIPICRPKPAVRQQWHRRRRDQYCRIERRRGRRRPAAPAKSSGWSDAPIDLSALKLANADFELSANSILYRKIQIGRSVLAVHLNDGKFQADLSQMALYQGKGQGTVTADGSGATPAIAANFNLSGVAVQPLLNDFAGFDRLIGSGTLTVDVAGHGKSQRDIIGSLGGKGSLDLTNGKITGVNLIVVHEKHRLGADRRQGRLQRDRFRRIDRHLYDHQRHLEEQRPQADLAGITDDRRRHRGPAAAAGRLQGNAERRRRARSSGRHNRAVERSQLSSRSCGRREELGARSRQVAQRA